MRPSTDEASSSPLPIPRRRRRRRSIHRRQRRISPSPSPMDDDIDDDEEEEQTYSNQLEHSSYATTDVPDDELEETDAAPDHNSSSYSSSNLIPTPSTYINVAPLPVFRGTPDECPVAHLSRFRRVCAANNAPSAATMLRIFPVSLDGEAALWCELNVDPCPSLSWEEVESAFLDAYRRPEFVDRARSDLVSLRQGETEAVNAYYLRMQWILKKWPEHGLPDELLKGIFVDGLREDFQDWIVPQRPESLKEAVRLASSWERARSVRAARRTREPAPKCGFCDGAGHEESGCEVRRRMKEMWVRSRGDLVDGSGGIKRAALGGEGKEGGEGEEGGLGRVVSMGRRSQCQCWKHQCWRKIERSNSTVVSEKNVANAD